MFKLLKKSLVENRLLLSILFLIYIYSSAVNIIVPYMNSYLIDALIQQVDKKFLIYFFSIIAVISVLGILVKYIYSLLKNKIKKNISFKLQLNVIEHIEHIPLEYVSQEIPTYLHQRIEQDVSQVTNFFIDNLYDVFINFIQLIILLFLFFNINHKIFLVILFFIPCYILVYLLMKKSIYKLGLENVEVSNKFYGFVNKEYERFKEIRIYSDYTNRENRMKKKYSHYLIVFSNYLKNVLNFSSLDQLITLIFQLMILIIGGFSIVKGEMTIGTYTLLNTYFTMILNNIKFLFEFGKQYQITKVSTHRLYGLLNKNKDNNGEKHLNTIDRINILNLNYCINGYNIFKETINYDINNPGIYMITGQNGTGKTTLTNIITGVYNIGKLGTVQINNIDIEHLDMIYIRKNNMSIMLQSEIFPEVTLNIYIKDYLDIDNLKRIFDNNINLKHLFISPVFNIYDHFEKKMQSLSSGEKQMVSLLGAISKDKDLYILDEPTSNVFNEVRTNLIKVLYDLQKKGKIVLVISHDNDIIKIGDYVIEL